MALGKRVSLPSARHKALGKECFNFFKKISSLPSASIGALDKEIIKKIKSLPSAVPGALGKVFFKKKIKKKILAECRVRGTRQSIFEKNFCRVPDLGHSAKKF